MFDDNCNRVANSRESSSFTNFEKSWKQCTWTVWRQLHFKHKNICGLTSFRSGQFAGKMWLWISTFKQAIDLSVSTLAWCSTANFCPRFYSVYNATGLPYLRILLLQRPTDILTAEWKYKQTNKQTDKQVKKTILLLTGGSGVLKNKLSYVTWLKIRTLISKCF